MTAGWAGVDMSAQAFGAATLDIVHCLKLLRSQLVITAVLRAVVFENILYLNH